MSFYFLLIFFILNYIISIKIWAQNKIEKYHPFALKTAAQVFDLEVVEQYFLITFILNLSNS